MLQNTMKTRVTVVAEPSSAPPLLYLLTEASTMACPLDILKDTSQDLHL